MYVFVKGLVCLITFSALTGLATSLFQTLEKNLPEKTYAWVDMPLVLLLLPAICGVLIYTIDELDASWRAKPDPGQNPDEVNIRDLLTRHAGAEGLGRYGRQCAETLLRREGDLSAQLRELEGEQLMLIEDSILYPHEMDATMHSMAYGNIFKFVSGLVTFCITFAPLYGMVELFAPGSSGMPLLYLSLFIALYATHKGMVSSNRLWNRLGLYGRHAIRRGIFYWPVALPLLIGLMLLIQG